MQKNISSLLACGALAVLGLSVTGCQQAPPVQTAAPAPAPSTTIIEEGHRDRPVAVDRDHPVVVDRNHPRPGEHPEDPNRRDRP